MKNGMSRFLTFAFLSTLISVACTQVNLPDARLAAPADTSKAEVGPALPNEAYLRKLSFHLKGENAAPEEYEELAAAESAKRIDKFFDDKIASYTKTPQFISKMSLRVNDLLRLRNPAILDHWPRHALQDQATTQFGTDFARDLEKSSYSFIVSNVVGQNQPWDNLLLTQKFRVYNTKLFGTKGQLFGMDDAGLFRQAYLGPLPPSRIFSPGTHATNDTNEYVDVDFPATFAQAGGILTTARFFDRYATTLINKNRRRAAAIYRIFLCDDMVPVAAGNANDPTEVLKLVFPKKDSGSGATLISQDMHGSDPACMKCHSKLDPVGVAFATSPFILSARPSLGVLNTEKLDGTKTATPYRGFQGLAQALVGQEKYSACQVQHFWSWFIGDDRALDASRQHELMTTFDSVGRRTADFVAALVRSPEFREAPSPVHEETLAELQTLVKPILRRCDTCHASSPEEKLPVLADDQIGGTAQTHVRNVARISKALDLINGGVGAKMPPVEARWLLSRDERSLLYRWTEKIAKGEKP
ncbi:hypothetical protein BH10BDE1_BH10BDE1_32750 [soil metagenome]